MQTTSLFRRAAALALTLVLAVSASLAGFATYDMPIQTVSDTESVYLFNLDTGKPILDQNAGQSRYIASLTKMMTALLFLESGKDLNEEITIPTSLTQEFKELGCTGTSFTCVHGLYDYGNVSTAEDLAKIASACYANETYMQVANTQSYTLPATNLHQNERAITSTNLMLNPEYAYYRDYIRGMKTGFTTLAGRCFVTFAEKDGHTYGLVVLGSDLDNIYRECAEILDWAFASFSDRQLTDTQTVLTTVPLTKCRNAEAVELYAAEPVSGYGHADDPITYSFEVPESVSATVKDNAVIGSATVYLDGYEIGTVDLVTHQEYISDFRTDLKTTLELLAALILILAVLSFATMVMGGGSLNLSRRRKTRRR